MKNGASFCLTDKYHLWENECRAYGDGGNERKLLGQDEALVAISSGYQRFPQELIPPTDQTTKQSQQDGRKHFENS
jgi:hypothetical protein